MKKNKNNNKKNIIQKYFLLSLLVIGLIAFVALLGNKHSDQNKSIETNVSEKSPLRVQGSADALVTITEFADFGCITCKAWHQFGIKEQVLEKYGDQVRFIWRDFPVITVDSPLAAEAGFCAHDQGKFWEYHDALYKNAPSFKTDNLKQYAAELGLDLEEFNQCLDSKKHTTDVEKELQEALSLGLRGTPSFFVNGQPLIGPPSFEQLSLIIDEIILNQNER